MSDTPTPLDRAIAAAGSLTKLASALGVHKSSIVAWRHNRIPAERVARIEAVTGVPRHELRPDLFAQAAA